MKIIHWLAINIYQVIIFIMTCVGRGVDGGASWHHRDKLPWAMSSQLRPSHVLPRTAILSVHFSQFAAYFTPPAPTQIAPVTCKLDFRTIYRHLLLNNALKAFCKTFIIFFYGILRRLLNDDVEWRNFYLINVTTHATQNWKVKQWNEDKRLFSFLTKCGN